jgi:nucleotide-binding universal stress UspA family protein
MTVVVGVDGSEGAGRAARWATDEARRRGTDVRMVHAWTFAIGGHAAEASNLALLASASQSLLDRCVAEARAAAPGVAIDGLLVERSPVHALIDVAASADLLVVGSSGRSPMATVLLGSVADGCVRHASVPTVVVRDGGRPDGPVVVGTDSSDGARRAVAWAAGEAALRRSTACVVHAWHLPGVAEATGLIDQQSVDEAERHAARVTEEAVDEVRRAGVAGVEGRCTFGGAAAALIEAAHGASMLVVGSRGLGGFSGLLLGSVSRAAVHAAPCPVVVVPA